MRTSVKQAFTLLPLLLAGCGGGSHMGMSQQGTPQPTMTAAMAGTSAQQQTSTYPDLVQHVYVAYFGRPADPGGLTFYANNYQAAGAPTDVGGVANAYFTSPAVKALIDSFSSSQESQDLYPGNNNVFVTAVYRNLFNRDPDPAGGNYWVNALNNNLVTRSNAALSIMSGAQGTDAQLIAMKAQVAANFTAAVNTPDRQSAYSGMAANAVVRNMLATVNLGTDITAFNATIEATLNQLVAANGGGTYAQVAQIIASRCVGCHSAHPTIPGFNPAPLGIMFDTSEQIHGQAGSIANVVGSGFMPYGNMTGMTAAERQVIADWFAKGAP